MIHGANQEQSLLIVPAVNNVIPRPYFRYTLDILPAPLCRRIIFRRQMNAGDPDLWCWSLEHFSRSTTDI